MLNTQTILDEIEGRSEEIDSLEMRLETTTDEAEIARINNLGISHRNRIRELQEMIRDVF